ncbi:MAG: D-alanyl-D-alanine carboxypeptidase family protein [Acutalibacteraceae bacterium]
MRKKKIMVLSAVLLAAVIALSCFTTAGAVTVDPGIKTKSDYIYFGNIDSETPVYTKNADKKCYPASTVKIMTYIIVSEKVTDFENTMVTIKQSVLDELYGTESSLSGLENFVDEKLSVLDLLYCMMVSSGNDAALVLADYVSGGNVDSFVKLMNDKAKELGLKNTNFVNPHGLHDEKQYTTAADMYRITKHAISLPKFMEICNTTSYKLGDDDENTLVTTNKLINPNDEEGYYYEYAKGIKTGTTDEAGFCLVSTAVKDGTAYMCVAMHADCYDENDDWADNGAMQDTKKLYEWAFDNLTLTKVVGEQDPVCELKINYSEKDKMFLVPEYSYSEVLPANMDKADIRIVPNAQQSVDAPIKQGEIAGTADIYYKDQKLTTINLIASETAEKSELIYGITLVKNVLTSPWFLGIAGVVLVLFIVYLVLIRSVGKGKRKKSKSDIDVEL